MLPMLIANQFYFTLLSLLYEPWSGLVVVLRAKQREMFIIKARWSLYRKPEKVMCSVSLEILTGDSLHVRIILSCFNGIGRLKECN